MALPANAYVYEFLYRGQPSGSLVAPSYHVIIACPSQDSFGNATTDHYGPMTPAAAVALGMTLPTIVSAINAALTAQIASLQAQVTALQASNSASAPASTIQTPA